MKITIIYDNETTKKDLKADWGFACLIEVYDRKILFDTGASGKLLLENMKKLQIDPKSIDEIFISHNHWDHIGGLKDLLKLKKFIVYLPSSCKNKIDETASKMIFIDKPTKLHDNIYSTGELKNIEQSLIIKTKKGLIIIVGCSHPEVKQILESASNLGNPIALIGGLHNFSDFNLLKNLDFIYPAHCTKYKKEIKDLYPKKYHPGGVGQIIIPEELQNLVI